MLIEKKRILLEDEVSDWLQIWTTASPLDVKGNKAIKKNLDFLANRLVFPNTVTMVRVKYDELFHDIFTSRRRVKIQTTSEMIPYFTITSFNKLITALLAQTYTIRALPSNISSISMDGN